jgi:hypothetical protein
MPELCQNCGAELYEGQQFCRRCGTPVSAVSQPAGEAPTQLFPREPALSTAQVGGETGRVAAGPQTAYHAASGFQKTAPLVGQPFDSRPLAVGPPAPPRGRRGMWVAALFVVFLLGAGLASGAAYFWWRATRGPVVAGRIRTGGGVPVAPRAPAVPDIPAIPAIPDLPADIGERIREALKGVPLPVDESGAVVSGDTTTLTRTFELHSAESFGAHVTSGNVTVVGGDDTGEAVVKIIKRGGSVQERAATRVLAAESEEGVTLVSAAPPNGRVGVSYEITVPRRGLERLELSAVKGDINVREFGGDLDLNVTTGNVSVSANGAVRSRVVNGKTSVGYVGRHEEAQEFSVVNGDVEVFLTGSGQEVDLKATATNGRIEVDRLIAAKAERRGSGQRVEAELGGGGAPLNVKVVNGNIRLKP